MHQYVMFLVQRLGLNVEELVFAYACVERALFLHGTVLRRYSVRSLMLGACVIARKVTRDHHVSLGVCFYQLCDVLDALEFEVLKLIERQMLEVLGWRLPMGVVLQTYADALFGAASEALGAVPLDAPQVLPVWEAPQTPATVADAMEMQEDDAPMAEPMHEPPPAEAHEGGVLGDGAGIAAVGDGIMSLALHAGGA